ncbi:UDP-N-acetylmuramoyl-tripeptide--D-alanyl-D-alanine ligase [uncultured Campylobacter sp.]|uniref:Mur ligase family protein n=1 Tax=uncultured Campylobacter sp. TaxID=218934 RepID=UPI0026288FEF|nr:UDP-N-acetylmuramoyl-tripeptide--D-alanyl-D-alanine ligase [uncultured Campylobacter sp.]
MNIIFLIAHAAFVLLLGFYLITCLQWFSYKPARIIFHFTKPAWHLYFLILPLAAYFGCEIAASLCAAKFGAAPLYALHVAKILIVAAYTLALWLWQKGLDKKLVFTPRVKRFFAILAVCVFSFNAAFYAAGGPILPIFLPLGAALAASFTYERAQAARFKTAARKKLAQVPSLTIIQITASYGKTSIKNFLYQILKSDFRCYKTPRSVNTLAGLVRDINEALPADTQIYIAEAGARLSGDIAEITEFLAPQIVVVGEIGAQHIEYFKSIENIRKTKLEALTSARLKHAFLHSSTQKSADERVTIYDEGLEICGADLDGIKFSLSLSENESGASGDISTLHADTSAASEENSISGAETYVVEGAGRGSLDLDGVSEGQSGLDFSADSASKEQGAEQKECGTEQEKQKDQKGQGTQEGRTGERYEFFAPILGKFNAANLAACIKIARFLGLSADKIKSRVAHIGAVEHRLARLDAGGKIIIDDSFNGNLSGMLQSYELMRSYGGRKVIITPGIVESTREDNETLAAKIDEIFDLAIITGELNSEVLQSKIDPAKTIVLKDKRDLQRVLSENTHGGDLILFSNDAPSFI